MIVDAIWGKAQSCPFADLKMTPANDPKHDFCRLFNHFVFFGVREWSKNAPGTRTIIFPVSIPHIVHSRPISSQFWHFRPSPILCISPRQRLFFFCNKKIQSKSFISPLWRISFALGHEKSVQSYPNRSHRHSESSNVFEKCHMGPRAQWAHGPTGPTGPKGPGPWALGSCTSKLFFLKPNTKLPGNL